jgi:hypothetical protein
MVYILKACKIFIFLIFFHAISSGIYAGGVADTSGFPDPETIYKLPDELVGEFIILSSMQTITIYQDNKFLLDGSKNSDSVLVGYYYGYVTIENNEYYLIPLMANSTFDKTNIKIVDGGFSFINKKGEWVKVTKKRNISLTLAEQGISFPITISKRQYYILNDQSETISAQVEFQLSINNGIVYVNGLSTEKIQFYAPPHWQGYLKILERNESYILGNVIADDFDFIEAINGVAIIKIIDKSIILEMECDKIKYNYEEYRMNLKYPIKFIIEF